MSQQNYFTATDHENVSAVYSHDDRDRSVPSIVSSFSNVPLPDERVPKCNSSMHVSCLNVCEDWCIVVLCFDLHVNSLFSQRGITVVKLNPMAVRLFGVVIQVQL